MEMKMEMKINMFLLPLQSPSRTFPTNGKITVKTPSSSRQLSQERSVRMCETMDFQRWPFHQVAYSYLHVLEL